jgi:hypothetical protein
MNVVKAYPTHTHTYEERVIKWKPCSGTCSLVYVSVDQDETSSGPK